MWSLQCLHILVSVMCFTYIFFFIFLFISFTCQPIEFLLILNISRVCVFVSYHLSCLSFGYLCLCVCLSLSHGLFDLLISSFARLNCEWIIDYGTDWMRDFFIKMRTHIKKINAFSENWINVQWVLNNMRKIYVWDVCCCCCCCCYFELENMFAHNIIYKN